MAKLQKSPQQSFPLGKKNYMLIAAGVVVSLIGFILMSGGGSDDPNVFNPAIFDTQRLTVAPIMVIGGYVIVLVAIMMKTDTSGEEATQTSGGRQKQNLDDEL